MSDSAQQQLTMFTVVSPSAAQIIAATPSFSVPINNKLPAAPHFELKLTCQSTEVFGDERLNVQ
jgi:hypothetical protein